MMQYDSTPKIVVPTRQQLLDQLHAANRLAWPLIGIQTVLIAACFWAIDWQAVVRDPLVTTIAICVMVGPFVMGLMQHWAQKKKEVDQLQEHTRFGQYDKHLLRRLFNQTLEKLNLPNDRLPLYITADRNLNAFAAHYGLGSFIKSLNGVYLNRQVLHKLEPDEVQDIIGHELGHYYRYYIVADRFRFITLLLGALIGVLAAQWVGMSHVLGYMVLSICAIIFWRLSTMPYARHGQTIEYLCDDHGAQVNGVEVSINGLLKIGAEAEAHLEIQHQALLSSKNSKLSGREVIEAIESAIPYGHASREDLEKAVDQALQRRKAAGPSLVGFLQYMWNSEADANIDEQLEEQARKHKKLQKLPRIDWEALLVDPREFKFDRSKLERLIEMIERQPAAALFRTPEAFGSTGDVHPPLKLRILYLWRNRAEIEAGSGIRR
jgi:Zn-dependent protease with chaperone function